MNILNLWSSLPWPFPFFCRITLGVRCQVWNLPPVFFTALLAWVGVPSFVQAIAMFAIYWKDFPRFGSFFFTSLYSFYLAFVDAKQLLIQQPPKKKQCEEREKGLLLPIWKPSSLLKPVPISRLQSSSNRAEKSVGELNSSNPASAMFHPKWQLCCEW